MKEPELLSPGIKELHALLSGADIQALAEVIRKVYEEQGWDKKMDKGNSLFVTLTRFRAKDSTIVLTGQRPAVEEEKGRKEKGEGHRF